MTSNLKLCGAALSGSVAGKGLNCVLQPFGGGRGPAPGRYALHPIDSPIFGQAAVLVPLGAGGTQAHQLHRPGGAGASWEWGNGPWGRAGVQRTAGAQTRPGAAPASGGNVATWDEFFRPASATPDWWVITATPITGRNCLRCALGFAELMAAARASQLDITVSQ